MIHAPKDGVRFLSKTQLSSINSCVLLKNLVSVHTCIINATMSLYSNKRRVLRKKLEPQYFKENLSNKSDIVVPPFVPPLSMMARLLSMGQCLLPSYIQMCMNKMSQYVWENNSSNKQASYI